MKAYIYEPEHAESTGWFTDDGGQFRFEYTGENLSIKSKLIQASRLHLTAGTPQPAEENPNAVPEGAVEASATAKYTEAKALLYDEPWCSHIEEVEE